MMNLFISTELNNDDYYVVVVFIKGLVLVCVITTVSVLPESGYTHTQNINVMYKLWFISH